MLVNIFLLKVVLNFLKEDFQEGNDTNVELVYLISPNGRPADNLKAVCQQYFAAHPEMILGTMEYDTGMYGPDSRNTVCVNHDPDFNLYETLRETTILRVSFPIPKKTQSLLIISKFSGPVLYR